jgi:hypothetical protein
MASVITPIENAIKPGCFAAECKSSKASSADVNLRTGDITNCTDTINICLQSVTVGGDMRGTLNQSCNINVEGGGANTGGLPTSLQQTISGPSANVVTSTDGLTRTVDGVSVDVSALIIKPGKSAFVDKYLPTPQKQKMAIGGAVAIVVLCFCLIILAVVASSSGGEKGSNGGVGEILAMQAQQQAAAASASRNAMRSQLAGLKKLATS